MRRGLVVVVAAAAAILVGLIGAGGQVAMCLGPIGVTQVQCIAAIDAAGPDWSPGPAPGAWIAVGLPIAVVVAALVSWRRLSSRRLATVVVLGILGAIGGAVVYEATRPMSLTGPTSSGAVITVLFPANSEARLLDAVIGAALASLISGVVLSSTAPARKTSPSESDVV